MSHSHPRWRLSRPIRVNHWLSTIVVVLVNLVDSSSVNDLPLSLALSCTSRPRFDLAWLHPFLLSLNSFHSCFPFISILSLHHFSPFNCLPIHHHSSATPLLHYSTTPSYYYLPCRCKFLNSAILPHLPCQEHLWKAQVEGICSMGTRPFWFAYQIHSVPLDIAP